MKRSLLLGLVAFGVAITARAEGGFWDTLRPDDLAATGWQKLSDSERAKLASLIEAYKNGPVSALAPKPAMVEAVTPAPIASSVGEAPRKTPTPRKKIVVSADAQVEYETIKSTIPGKFEGWSDQTVFKLANGQAWQVANGGKYYTSPIENPEVEIAPSKLGGFWLKIPAIDQRVRVKLLSR